MKNRECLVASLIFILILSPCFAGEAPDPLNPSFAASKSSTIDDIEPGALIREELMLPGRFENGDGQATILLESLIVRPDDKRRHPLAVI
ncbi:MAG: hypothetical protein HQK55_17285, partial [Deltaproteobacteria bacterium]|nr:hypothetical protein [Deltaproteobacteria bacterium]